MKNITEFNIPFILPGTMQYDPDEILRSDIVTARYRRCEGYTDNPNICALPEAMDGNMIFADHTIPLKGYDRNAVLKMSREARIEMLMRIREMRLPLPFHASVEAEIHNALIRSYANRIYSIAEDPDCEDLTLNGRSVGCSMRSRKNGLMSTPPAFSLIGTAGTGKTGALILSLRHIPKAVIHDLGEVSYIQIPVIMVTAPANSNLKALIIQIGQVIDDILGGAPYYSDIFAKQTNNVGKLSNMLTRIIKMFSIGMIIIDEIQLMDFGNSAKSFENFLSITSNSGVALCCVGTPDALDKIAGDLRIYRRLTSVAIRSDEYCRDRDYVRKIIGVLWGYSFTETPVHLTENTTDLIMKLSGGSIDAIIKHYITIQRHAVYLEDPGIMDTEYIRKLLSSEETEKTEAMIKASENKSLYGLRNYRRSISETDEEHGKKEAELSDMLSPEAYKEACDKNEVMKSIMNVFDDYSETDINMAYAEASQDEEFSGLQVSDKTKKVISVLKAMRSGERKPAKMQGIRKSTGKRKSKVISDSDLMAELKEAAGGV